MGGSETLGGSEPVAFIRRHEERGGEWLAVICRVADDGENVEVLTIGVEMTEGDAQAWAEKAIANRSWEPDGIPTPDAYDRGKIRPT